MADNIRRKCLKCGLSPKENPEIKLYRFPNPGPTNILRSELWAKFCFPENEWYSLTFQKKLYAEHRMLCSQHFKPSDFTDFAEKRLNRSAVPDVPCNEQAPSTSIDVSTSTLTQPATITLPTSLEHQDLSPQILMDITNITNKRHNKHNTEPVPGPSHILAGRKSVENQNKTVSASNQEKSKRENVLYKKCRLYIKRIWKMRNTIKKQKNLESLNNLHNNLSYQKLVKRLTPSFAILLQSQLKNVKRKIKGRRWTLDEKIIALRLYKRSPMCYRLLRRMWCLPTQATLKSLLGRFELTVGINKNIIQTLEDHVKRLEASDNEFVMMFDEMSIKKHFEYNSKSDKIEGYQDHGPNHGRSEQVATHALVFMIVGLRKREKQPIAFYLSSSYVTADRLAVLIKEVLKALFDIGLCVTATVCDMDGVNRRALTILGATKEKPYFMLLDNEVVTLFDPPHLLKCFRNLFLKYDIKCTTNIMSSEQIGQGVAKWSHIKDFFDKDNQNLNFVFAPALRKEHLNPNTKEKMRVKLAAQVFSHSVAAGMYAKISEGQLPSGAIVTADVVSNIDRLFDALNSETPDLRRGKPYSTNISDTSPHKNLFFAMKNFFSTLQFLDCKRIPPLQQGWIWSINAVERIWSNLKEKHRNIKSLATRRLQQDPLENLFGIIRGNCGANSNPTVGQFIAALKTGIMSNLAHFTSGNCEEDKNESMIRNLKKILVPTQIISDNDENKDFCLVTDSLHESFLEKSTESSELQACAYVCGFILKRNKNKCQTCDEMLKNVDCHDEMFNFMQFKEYSDYKKSLIYSSKDFVNCVEFCATIVNNLLSTIGHTVNLKKIITNEIKKNVNFDFLKCHHNENVDLIINNVFAICVKRFCTLRNREFYDDAALRKKINIIKHI